LGSQPQLGAVIRRKPALRSAGGRRSAMTWIKDFDELVVRLLTQAAVKRGEAAVVASRALKPSMDAALETTVALEHDGLLTAKSGLANIQRRE